MGATAIITNHQYRPLKCWFELPERWRTEFDYLTDENDQVSPRFVKYKNQWYDVGDCMPTAENGGLRTLGFEVYHGCTYFSCVAFKWPPPNDCDDLDRVICALVLS